MRLKSLDGLRGLAAVTVVLHHWLYCFKSYWEASPWPGAPGFGALSLLNVPPLHGMVNGNGAVLIFFVLSGVVLTIALEKMSIQPYLTYTVNRFLRIFPAFAVSILAAGGIAQLISPTPISTLSDWFNASWSDPVTSGLVASHLVMIDGPKNIQLNNVMWSLVVELRISFVMPLIYFATKRSPLLTVVGAGLLSLAAHGATFIAPEPLISLLQTLRYVVLFALGSAIALHRAVIIDRVQAASGWETCVALSLIIVLYGFPFGRGLRLYLAAPAAVMITILAFAQPMFRSLLECAPFQYLGRISYSLYLVHLPVILVILHLFYGQAPLFALFLAVLGASFLAAEALYVGVERPFHRLARAFGGRAAKKVSRSPGGLLADRANDRTESKGIDVATAKAVNVISARRK